MNDKLNVSVLVLNKFWQAVNICPARRALSLLYQKRVQVIKAEEENFNIFGFEEWKVSSQNNFEKGDGFVRTVSFKLKIPQIIILPFYDRLPKKEIKFNRENIYERDGYTCQYCGERLGSDKLNLDHFVPRTRGGVNSWENVVTSCLTCNLRKGNRTLEEAGMRLIRKPSEPHWHPFMKNISLKYDSWKHFLDFAYWKAEVGEEE